MSEGSEAMYAVGIFWGEQLQWCLSNTGHETEAGAQAELARLNTALLVSPEHTYRVYRYR